MKWSDRMKTEIKVGFSYFNREGVKMDVVKMIDENNFHVKDTTNNNYHYPGYTDGYFVNKYGGFGNYPNHRDLTRRADY